MSVRPSVGLSSWNNSAPTGRILIKFRLSSFIISDQKIQVPFKSDKNNGYFIWEKFPHLWQYLAKLFLEWETFQIKVVENIKTLILCSTIFARKSCRLWDSVEKYGGARQAANNYGGPLHAGLVRLHARKHTAAPVHTHTHTKAYSVAIYNPYYFHFRLKDIGLKSGFKIEFESICQTTRRHIAWGHCIHWHKYLNSLKHVFTLTNTRQSNVEWRLYLNIFIPQRHTPYDVKVCKSKPHSRSVISVHFLKLLYCRWKIIFAFFSLT